MKFTLIFQCGLVENCPHCEQEWPETACDGGTRVEVEAPTQTPTNGYLIAQAGGYPDCPECGNQMVLTNRYETPTHLVKE